MEKLNGKPGFVDLFWEGRLLVEMKSRGKDLDKAYTQGLDYFHGLEDSQMPRFVLVSDFARIRLYDLDTEEAGAYEEFPLSKLPDKVERFAFMLGKERKHLDNQEQANIKAAELLGQLHDAVEANGYTGRDLEILLVRILFCLFAEDTGIFGKDDF